MHIEFLIRNDQIEGTKMNNCNQSRKGDFMNFSPAVKPDIHLQQSYDVATKNVTATKS